MLLGFFDGKENSFYCNVMDFASFDREGIMYCDLAGLNKSFFVVPCTAEEARFNLFAVYTLQDINRHVKYAFFRENIRLSCPRRVSFEAYASIYN